MVARNHHGNPEVIVLLVFQYAFNKSLFALLAPTAQIFYLRSRLLSSLIKTQGPSYSPCGCCCLFFLLTVNSTCWVFSAANPKALSKKTMAIIFIQRVKKTEQQTDDLPHAQWTQQGGCCRGSSLTAELLCANTDRERGSCVIVLKACQAACLQS